MEVNSCLSCIKEKMKEIFAQLDMTRAKQENIQIMLEEIFIESNEEGNQSSYCK